MAETFPTGVITPTKLSRCMKSGQSHSPSREPA
jgi:hypothetical protein